MLVAPVALTLVLLANVASAEPAKIFQLSGPSLPASLKTAPEKLTQVLATAFGAKVSIVSIEDAADMVNCSLTAQSCLEDIASKAAVKRIIFGRVDARDDGMGATSMVVVKLTMFDAAKGEQQRNFTLAGDTTADLVTALEEKLDLAAKPEEKPTKVEPKPTPAQPSPTTSGGVTTSTWVMIVGGAVTMGGGFALIGSANGLRRQVAQAPTDTLADIDRLRQLETAGRQRMQIGAGVAALGGVITTIGVVRLVMQKRSQPEKPMLDVVPENGGAMVTFRMGWR
jgi:hypothetical protein